MYILITGAAGFIGQLVAKALLDDPSYTVLLTDIIEPPIPEGAKYPQNAKALKADLQAAAGRHEPQMALGRGRRRELDRVAELRAGRATVSRHDRERNGGKRLACRRQR